MIRTRSVCFVVMALVSVTSCMLISACTTVNKDCSDSYFPTTVDLEQSVEMAKHGCKDSYDWFDLDNTVEVWREEGWMRQSFAAKMTLDFQKLNEEPLLLLEWANLANGLEYQGILVGIHGRVAICGTDYLGDYGFGEKIFVGNLPEEKLVYLTRAINDGHFFFAKSPVDGLDVPGCFLTIWRDKKRITIPAYGWLFISTEDANRDYQDAPEIVAAFEETKDMRELALRVYDIGLKLSAALADKYSIADDEK